MRNLLRWHSCEEIEHKSVAFDVFQEVSGNWPIRVLGAVLALGGLIPLWNLATRHLLKQENMTRAELRADRKRMEAHGRDRRYLVNAFFDYLRRDFHPDDTEDYHLAAEWLAAHGRLDS
jgi:predicted metal-dependent hydrolase